MPTVTSYFKDSYGPSITGGLQEQYQVFVTKIPVLVPESYLRHYFSIKVGDLKRLQIAASNEKKGNTYQALVEFSTRNALKTCLSQKYHEVPVQSSAGVKTLTFECRECMSTSRRKQLTKQIMDQKRKVYLPALPLQATEALIRAEMSYHGIVEDVEIIPKPEQGKKIAFVIFKEPKKGEEVAAKKYLKIKLASGQELEVECQLALNPQQLHARKQQASRKDSNDASTDYSEDSSFRPNEQKSSRQVCVVDACLPKQTADSRGTFGAIGNRRVSPSAKSFQSTTKAYSLFFPTCRRTQGVEFRPELYMPIY